MKGLKECFVWGKRAVELVGYEKHVFAFVLRERVLV